MVERGLKCTCDHFTPSVSEAKQIGVEEAVDYFDALLKNASLRKTEEKITNQTRHYFDGQESVLVDVMEKLKLISLNIQGIEVMVLAELIEWINENCYWNVGVKHYRSSYWKPKDIAELFLSSTNRKGG